MEAEAAGEMAKPAMMPVGFRNPTDAVFTDEVRKTILAALAGDHSRRSAAGLAGIQPDTLYGWIRRGETEEDTEFAKFAADVLRAEATAQERSLKTIRDARQRGDTKAAAYLLDRRAKAEAAAAEGTDRSQTLVVKLTWPGAGKADEDMHDIEDAVVLEDSDAPYGLPPA